MEKIFSCVGIVLIFAYIVWSSVHNFRRAMQGDDLSVLVRAEEEFRALLVHHELPEFCFDGRTAQVIRDSTEGLNDSSGVYTLHRICRFARNTHGEYFYFMSEGSGRPFFKHVSQGTAKIALGKKYIPPLCV
jgi:hypothetical protein